MFRFKYRLKRLLPFVVFSVQFIIAGLVMRLDPDPHHDGILYGAAINVKSGGFPNRDSFAQYGPLVPELQGLWLRVFGPSLLNIRLQALLLFLLSSILIWHVCKFYLSITNSYLISTAWILTIPAVLPWPTIYSSVLAICSLLLISDLKSRTLRLNPLRTSASSSLIAVGTFGRIHLIAIFVLVSVFYLLQKNHRSMFKFWVLGYFSSVILILYFLFLNNALGSFVTQCITWPFLRYAGPTLNKSYFVGLMWYPLIAFSFLAVLWVVAFSQRKTNRYLVISIVPTIFFVSLFMASKIDRIGYLSLRNPRVLLIDYSRNMMNSLDYFVATLMIISFILIVIRFKPINPFIKISVFYSAGILTQLYPLYDVNHLWLIAPLLIISTVITFGDSKPASALFKPGLTLTLFGLISGLLIQIAVFVTAERVPFESASLRGMYAPSAFAKQLDETMINLEKYVLPNSTSFDCVNGIYAGAGGEYLSSTKQFVSWGPDSYLVTKGENIFACAITNKQIAEFQARGYFIAFKDPLTLFGDSEPRGYWNVLFRFGG